MSDHQKMESDIESTLDALVSRTANIPFHEAAERIYKLGTDYINTRTQLFAGSSAGNDEDCVGIYGGPTTPGAPRFFMQLWGALVNRVQHPPLEAEVHEEHITRLVDFVSSIQAKTHPEGEEWFIGGQKCRWDSLPLLGAEIRDAHNEQIDTMDFNSSILLSQEAQTAVAGAVQLEPKHLTDESTESDIIRLAKSRHQWLSFQSFISRLWRDCGRNEYAMYAIWALRPALEDWPESPPACDTKYETLEESPAYLAFQVEAASVWICNTASLMYECTEIYGPRGDPNWPTRNAPGRGGRRWDGVDGYDREHKRWQLWKDVLGEVIQWCDRAAKDQMQGWKVRDAAVRALEAMKAAERQ
ncbi:unnamed protein product [Rhizoctonia solani]|uniref:Uncharacterized protein n=1 Tax=Rhizoctonia solani TaxID=456999 RepID=A0A8H3E389_9AGAM|nr:unnamed protein product [Rhizoctonia solani]